MTGPAAYARHADTASAACERLEAAQAAAVTAESAQRELLAAVVELWPTSAWVAAGATTAKRWLLAYTRCSEHDAHRLERLAGLCHRHPALAEAVVSGSMSMARANRLGTAVTDEREPWLAESLPGLLTLNTKTSDDDDFATALRYWASLVDQERTVRREPRHALVLSQRLFGGGQIHGDLSPSSFLNIASALDAWTDDPDPKDAPHQRTLAERRADALDDLCRTSLDPDDTRWGSRSDDDDTDDDDWERAVSEDPFDGFSPTDDLDEHLADAEDGDEVDMLDPMAQLEAIRRRLHRVECQRRRRANRRTRSRSAATINVHIDLRTLDGLRDITDLDDLILRGDGWTLTKQAAERLLCDASLVAVLFDGKGTLLDANDAAERWTRKQRRAITARDGGCVFPSCQRPPRFCDIHHLHHRGRDGPTRTGNGAMLCRFHHRLIHEYGWQLLIENDHWVAVDPHGTHWTGRPTDIEPASPREPVDTAAADPPATTTRGSPTRPADQTHR